MEGVEEERVGITHGFRRSALGAVGRTVCVGQEGKQDRCQAALVLVCEKTVTEVSVRSGFKCLSDSPFLQDVLINCMWRSEGK